MPKHLLGRHHLRYGGNLGSYIRKDDTLGQLNLGTIAKEVNGGGMDKLIKTSVQRTLKPLSYKL